MRYCDDLNTLFCYNLTHASSDTFIRTKRCPTSPHGTGITSGIEQKNHIIEEQRKRLRLMEEKLRLAQIRRFGASSEKLPHIGDLFDEAELEAALYDIETRLPPDEAPPPRSQRRKPR